jgi:hypothetical protein
MTKLVELAEEKGWRNVSINQKLSLIEKYKDKID